MQYNCIVFTSMQLIIYMSSIKREVAICIWNNIKFLFLRYLLQHTVLHSASPQFLFLCYLLQHTVLHSASPQLQHLTLVSFLHLFSEQTLHFLTVTDFLPSFVTTRTILRILSPPCRQSSVPVTSCPSQGRAINDVDD